MDIDSDVPVTIAESDEGPLMSDDLFGRFTALAAPVEARGRRLVLVSSTQVDSVLPTVPDSRDALQVDNDGESDTESNRTVTVRGREEDVVDAGSEVEPFNYIAGAADDEGEAFARPPPRTRVMRVALETLDEVDLGTLFVHRVSGMKSVPRHLVGPFRNAMRVALEEVSEAAGTQFNWRGDGNSFCCSPECCCTGHPEVG